MITSEPKRVRPVHPELPIIAGFLSGADPGLVYAGGGGRGGGASEQTSRSGVTATAKNWASTLGVEVGGQVPAPPLDPHLQAPCLTHVVN